MKSSEVKIFSAILVVAVILVGLSIAPIFLAPKKRTAPSVPPPTVNRELLVPANSHLRGDPKAPSTIVVFSDFQCPSCREGVKVLHDVAKDNPGQFNVVFHHFQARPDHVHSEFLSRAAEAASEQGKFWEMHDILFEKQEEIISESAEDVAAKTRDCAKKIGLDMMKFDITMARKENTAFERDNDIGVKAGIRGTPTFFVIDSVGKVRQYNSNQELKQWADSLKS